MGRAPGTGTLTKMAKVVHDVERLVDKKNENVFDMDELIWENVDWSNILNPGDYVNLIICMIANWEEEKI